MKKRPVPCWNLKSFSFGFWTIFYCRWLNWYMEEKNKCRNNNNMCRIVATQWRRPIRKRENFCEYSYGVCLWDRVCVCVCACTTLAYILYIFMLFVKREKRDKRYKESNLKLSESLAIKKNVYWNGSVLCTHSHTQTNMNASHMYHT